MGVPAHGWVRPSGQKEAGMASPASVPDAADPGAWARVRSALGIGSLRDWLFARTCQAAALSVIFLVGLILALLIVQALPALRTVGGALLTGTDWHPSYNPTPD